MNSVILKKDMNWDTSQTVATTHEPSHAVTRNKSQVVLKAGQASDFHTPAKPSKNPTILLLRKGGGGALTRASFQQQQRHWLRFWI